MIAEGGSPGPPAPMRVHGVLLTPPIRVSFQRQTLVINSERMRLGVCCSRSWRHKVITSIMMRLAVLALGIVCSFHICSAAEPSTQPAEKLQRYEFIAPKMGTVFRIVFYAPDKATADR